MNYCDGLIALPNRICGEPAAIKHAGKWWCEYCYEQTFLEHVYDEANNTIWVIDELGRKR